MRVRIEDYEIYLPSWLVRSILDYAVELCEEEANAYAEDGNFEKAKHYEALAAELRKIRSRLIK